MTPTRTETLSLTDGRTLRLTVAEPENSVRGGLVVLHEARGVTDAVRGLVSGLAAEGWLTVAPHLYHGAEDEPADAAERASGLAGESVLADTDVAFVWLGERGVSADRLGVIGFDLGGSVAMVVAGSRSIGAAVTVGGGGILEPLSDGLPSLVEVAEELACPWLGLYGDDDAEIPSSHVAKLRDAAAAAPVATDVVRFERTDHRFDARPDAGAEAWQRTLNWFDSHLR
ncbi:dienelactone hydrolase family protein [Saccharothrix algeriensis]|uniref:Carboxymethylenebutenolidase n=1 Tax=Saccharothrix algeriensis TaxID=173560 RepID=A0A8T8I5J7_9PSEU|nr:dienelactone hydrolase family protein [Saccharothrix algeriensis]MBM7812007.1 carboxymethylenebutenolidase [Saccharothrix algeriensis]QTR05700.1 dienelactone hydrolase family protein [Saccharothrix algeriensis]